MPQSVRLLLTVSLTLCLGAPFSAAADDVNITLPAIPVQGVRNPQEIDFGNAQRHTTKFMSVPQSERDKARLVWVATGTRMTRLSPEALSQLRLDVESGDQSWPVEIKDSGEVVFPTISADKVKDAQIVANVPKGSLVLSMRVRIVPPEGPMTLQYLNDAASQARVGWKRASGGIAAMTVPRFTCAKFRFLRPKSIAITQGGQQVWAATAATEIDVPLSITGVSDSAEVRWLRDSDDQVSGCKLS